MRLGMRSIALKIPGREQLELSVETDAAGLIQKARLTGIGSQAFLADLSVYRKNLKGKLQDLPLPTNHSPAGLLITEAILKLRGEWQPPYTEEEICHCRNVPLAVVDAAIVAGAHTPAKVSAWTSASTQCGTCRPDVEAYLRFRLRSGN